MARKFSWKSLGIGGLSVVGLILIGRQLTIGQIEVRESGHAQARIQQKSADPSRFWSPLGSPRTIGEFGVSLARRAARDSPSDAIGHLLTAGGGLGVLFFWGASLCSYRKQKHWERVNFTLEQVRKFEDDPSADLARSLIDANAWVVKLECDDEDYYIADSHVIKALEPYRDNSDGFSAGEIAVRKSFDAFLESMERFRHLLETGLIDSGDLYPYLHYWLDVLGGSQGAGWAAWGEDHSWKDGLKSQEWRNAVFRFADSFGYVGFRQLMAGYGYSGIPAKVVERRATGQSNCCLVNPSLPKPRWRSHLLINTEAFEGALEAEAGQLHV